MQNVMDSIERNFDAYVDDLARFLSMPSVSTRPDHADDVMKCARWLCDHLLSAGFSRADVIETDGHPIVIAEHSVSDDLPTVLAYGHYDVQPPDPIEKWTSPPFEASVRDNVLYARGAVDDKGQLMMIVKAFQAYVESKTPLPLNLRVILEGEEECGSVSLELFMESHREWLDCDVLLVCDTAMPNATTPGITCSLRGNTYMEFGIGIGTRDLHSGAFGGAALNVMHVLGEIISGLHDEQGRVAIPGFYDDVAPIDEEVRDEIRRMPFDEARWREGAGGAVPAPEAGFEIAEVTRVRPCVDVHGVWGGYQDDGAKTIIPHAAHVKLSARLVANQEPGRTFEQIKSWVESVVPPGVEVETIPLGFAHPVSVSTSSPGVTAAKRALRDVFDKDPVIVRGGGSIPAVSMFRKHFDIDAVLMGFGLLSDNVHAPDERFGLDRFRLGIKSVARFFQHYGESGVRRSS